MFEFILKSCIHWYLGTSGHSLRRCGDLIWMIHVKMLEYLSQERAIYLISLLL